MCKTNLFLLTQKEFSVVYCIIIHIISYYFGKYIHPGFAALVNIQTNTTRKFRIRYRKTINIMKSSSCSLLDHIPLSVSIRPACHQHISQSHFISIMTLTIDKNIICLNRLNSPLKSISNKPSSFSKRISLMRMLL